MKPGDIVRTTCDLTPLHHDFLPSGTRLRLERSRTTNSGKRWVCRTNDGQQVCDIPEDAMEVTA